MLGRWREGWTGGRSPTTGLGGVAAVILGAIADAVDLRTALIVTAMGPAIGVGVSLLADRRLFRTPVAAAVD